MCHLQIRAFSIGDQPAVIDLWRACGLTRPWNDPRKDIERKLSEQPELFLVGLLDGRLVAAAMFGYDGHRGSVSYFAVLPEYQRHGFGRRLMQAGEQMLLARGCPKINLLVRTTNSQVIAFYESLGYHMDDVIELGKRLIDD